MVLRLRRGIKCLLHPSLTFHHNAKMADKVDTSIAPSIGVKDLSYAFPDGSSGLKEVFLELPPGSRTLLIGGLFPQFPRTSFFSSKL
jgi:hypothetical protein